MLENIAQGNVALPEDLGSMKCDWGCRMWVKYATRILPAKQCMTEDKIRDVLHDKAFRDVAYPFQTLESVKDPLQGELIPIWRYFVLGTTKRGTPLYDRSQELANVAMHLHIPMHDLRAFHARFLEHVRWSGQLADACVITRGALLYWAGKYAEDDFGDFLNFVVDLSGCNFDPRQSCSRSALARESNGFYFVFDFCDTLRFLRTLCAMDESQMTSLVYGYADQRGIGIVTCERMKEIISELHSSSPLFFV